MASSDQNLASTRQRTRQLVAVLPAGPGAGDMPTFEEIPISPRAQECPLGVNYETQPPGSNRHVIHRAAVTSSAFGENVDRLGSIRSILDNYPFSAGLLREILQNSDDAEATVQTFLLDCRVHPSERICHPSIANTQGPALLAFNNARFSEKDWVALQNISRSSKREDTSKIGKFGIGIRSCYHVTDFLQILSGEDLVIFDPQSVFSDTGGSRFVVTSETIEPIRDHLQAFGHFLPPEWDGEAFDGTVIRLPLRTEPGKIREKIVSPQEIRQLFHEFIEKELSIAMLFLQHLRSIKFTIIDEEGHLTKMARCVVEVAERLSDGAQKQVVSLHHKAEEEITRNEEWLVVHSSFPKDDVLKQLSARTGSPCAKVLEKHKLSADVGLAFPLNSTHNIEPDNGHLFTFLRLPIKTGFPAHIHSLFSLTPSRQNLRPHGENGIVPGSDDYILIEWNKLLFDSFIPHSWSLLLKTIPIHFPTTPIFSAWPTAKDFTESDNAYWSSFPMKLIDTILETEAPVWPVVAHDVYKQPRGVFFARPSTSDEVIQALADLGMSICRPPEHLFRMIETLPNWEHRILTPERTSYTLRVIFASGPFNAPAHRHAMILEYLLSSNNIGNIVGLPVIPTVSGGFISVSQQDATPEVYTLLESADVEVFKLCDENAISPDDLPASVVRLFREQALLSLNVKWLDPEQVVRYLTLHPTLSGSRLPQDGPDGSAVAFLAHFWAWLDCWDHRSPLFTKLESEAVLPCVGGLRRALRSQPVFDPTGLDPALSTCLYDFGVPFLSSAFNPEARDILRRHGFLNYATEMHALLDAISTAGGSLSDQDAQLLFNHFNRHMVNYTWHSFSERQKIAFRRLPIFQIVKYDANASNCRHRGPVHQLLVHGVQSFDLLPVLPSTVFVDVNVDALDSRLLPLLNESEHSALSDMEVLDLCVKSLDQQPKNLLAHMLQYIANTSHRDGLTSLLLQSLRSVKYAYCAQGTREAPKTLIDPSSALYPLYANTKQRLHSLEDAEERSIADSLSSLGLLDKALSAANIADRIDFISSTASFGDAVELLKIIYEHGFNCHSLTLDGSARWIPTQNGTLATAAECRPGKGVTLEECHLFDKVLKLVNSGALLSPSLRTVLGWDDPVPMDILLRQFEEVLNHPDDDVYHRVKNLIKELSDRQLSLTASQWSSMCQLLEGRRWVPTSEYTLVESWQVVFSSSFQGIYTVAPDLGRIDSKSRRLLTKLNCLPSPSFTTVARRLSQLASEIPSPAVTSSAIATLKSAVSLPLTDAQRSQLFVPDDIDRLQPIQDVFFNDVGEHSRLLSRNEVCLASSSIDDDLAKDLGLQRLGLKYVHLQTLGEDMGVTPATLVEKTLAQYTDKQFLLEFLANAQDAGASKLLVVLNEYASVEGNFLSSDLQRLYDGPSVIVYNDSEFSDLDFKGICSTHIGGKVGNPDSIGQFGLGALTMFHITECAIIYSGDKVLFLDPSKSYLPIFGRASLLMPLKDLHRVYPGHTGYLKDLEFFDPRTCRVNGTIFFLPLRSSSLALKGKRPLFPAIYSVDTFQQTILRDFHEKAGECLLFIQIDTVEAQRRTAAQSITALWSLTACPKETTFDGVIEKRLWIDSCAWSSKKTSSEWLTMSSVIERSAIPQECKAGAASKTLRVGLAAPLGDMNHPQCKFFSMLPLAIPTALPVHVNASFRLSSDRRQIRLDDYDNDTLFNRWVLETQLPPLYLALLERIAQERNNSRWWPGTPEDVHPSPDVDENDGVVHEDVATAIMVKAFYSHHLPKSSRRVFYSMYSNESFTKSDAVLYPTRPKTSTALTASIPSSVERIIETLKPKHVIKPIESVAARLEGVQLLDVMGPGFIRQLLLNGGGETIRGGLSKKDLESLLDWLVGEDEKIHLLEGLPLLILQDDTWRVFKPEGQTFYGSSKSPLFVEEGLFPADRFIHPNAISEKLLKLLSSSAFRIAELDAAGLRQLVEDRLLGLDPSAKVAWVDLFWRMYPELPRTKLLASIETLPLVPKTSGTALKSLIECKESGLINDDVGRERLVEYFQDMGIDVIPVERFPSELRDVLQSGAYNLRGSLFSRFLRCVSPIIETAVDRMKSWSPDRQSDFAKWVRKEIWTFVHRGHMRVVRELPVWPARRGSEVLLCSANEVRLLPRNISIEAGRFSQSFLTEDDGLTLLDIPRQTLPQLYHALTFPRFLAEGEDERIYKDLLTSFLKLTTRDIPPIPVPNASRVMVHCNTLVDRTTLFMAAFSRSSSLFLLPSFNLFTSRLEMWGFKLTLDFDLFLLCAQAIQDDDRPDSEKLDRARIVYQAYCDSLPVYLPSKEQWKSLDNIRFIPRDVHESRRIGSQEVELPGSIRGLPLLVSPHQVVQKRFHNISWTQRTVLQEDPHERILVAFKEFGTPSVEEVIAHLRVLSASPHRLAILPDLKATYEWLNQQESSALETVGPLLHDHAVFLNVNNPEKDDWSWSSASRMAFEVEGLTNIQGVRKFLENYRTFLIAAGVLEAHYPAAEEDGEHYGSPHDLKSLQSLVQHFNEQRFGGKFTDVLFLPYEEASGRTREQLYGLGGPSLRGHQIFLAGCATWFKKLFLDGSLEGAGWSADGVISVTWDDSGNLDHGGDFGFAAEGSANEDTLGEKTNNTVQVVLLPKSRAAIRAVLDFFYTGRPFPKEAEVTLEDLLQTLELANYLGIQSLSVLSQGEIIRRKLVNPESLQEVRRRSQRLGANIVGKWCDDFEKANPKLFELVARHTSAME